MKIECFSGGLYVCPGEVLMKPAFLRDPYCVINPGCGAEYCWQFQLGGCCLEARLSLYLAPDLVTPIHQQIVIIKSPDINADGFVSLIDFAIFAQSIAPAPYDVCADLNCDGIVDVADVIPSDPFGAIFGNHYTHSCDYPIPVDASTWGAIKELYTD